MVLCNFTLKKYHQNKWVQYPRFSLMVRLIAIRGCAGRMPAHSPDSEKCIVLWGLRPPQIVKFGNWGFASAEPKRQFKDLVLSKMKVIHPAWILSNKGGTQRKREICVYASQKHSSRFTSLLGLTRKSILNWTASAFREMYFRCYRKHFQNFAF